MSNNKERSFEREQKADGATDNRVTPKRIDRAIERVDYHQFKNTTTTVCCITLRNGFTCIGESACVDPENFNRRKGEAIAYDNARQKIWALEGYLIRDRMHNGADFFSCVDDLDKKISHGERMFRKLAQKLDIDLKGHPLSAQEIEIEIERHKHEDQGKDVVPQRINLPSGVTKEIINALDKSGVEQFLVIEGERLRVIGEERGGILVVPATTEEVGI